MDRRDQLRLTGMMLVILGAALMLALGGYEVLLYQEKPVGTLDNIVTFIAGGIVGAVTSGAGTAMYMAHRQAIQTGDEPTTIQPPPDEPTLPGLGDVVAGHDQLEGT